MKNKTKIFFVLTLLALILAVSSVNAVDDDTTDTVSQTPTTDASSDVISTEQAQTSSDDKIINTENKKIEKEDKNIKKEPVTIDGVEYTQVFENQILDETNVFTDPNDEDYYLFIMRENTFINNCTVKGSTVGDTAWGSSDNINVYINSSTITPFLQVSGNYIINNSNISSYLLNMRDFEGKLYIYNSIINSTIDNTGYVYIDDYSTL